MVATRPAHKIAPQPETAGLYLHFPFCNIRCGYCDFFTVTKKPDLIPAYLEALMTEAEIYAKDSAWQSRPFSTIFFGGGTPSLLQLGQISSLLNHFQKQFNFCPEVEITLETNPNTVNREKLASFLSAGINRLSFGVQSFHTHELNFLDRDHSQNHSLSAFENARQVGFENISVDLIHSLPGQSMQDWRYNLKRTIAIAPEHISAYCLTYEEGTPLSVLKQKGKFKPAAEERQREIQLTTIDFLEKSGYPQYEISNFAKPGFESQHNQKYWDGSPYLGLGPSSHSYAVNQRWWNIANLNGYIKSLKNNILPVQEMETLTSEAFSFEKIYLGLRQMQGVNLRAFEHTTGVSIFQRYRPTLEKFFGADFNERESSLTAGRSEAYTKLLQIKDGFLQLTQEGTLLSDSVFSEFL